jgi:hypothetical protein
MGRNRLIPWDISDAWGLMYTLNLTNVHRSKQHRTKKMESYILWSLSPKKYHRDREFSLNIAPTIWHKKKFTSFILNLLNIPNSFFCIISFPGSFLFHPLNSITVWPLLIYPLIMFSHNTFTIDSLAYLFQFQIIIFSIRMF